MVSTLIMHRRNTFSGPIQATIPNTPRTRMWWSGLPKRHAAARFLFRAVGGVRVQWSDGNTATPIRAGDWVMLAHRDLLFQATSPVPARFSWYRVMSAGDRKATSKT